MPIKIPFDRFCERYDLIHAEVRAEHPPGKKAACLILKAANLDHSSYKTGKSMVFLKANQIQILEDARDKIIEKNIMKLQQQAKIFLAKKDFTKREEIRDAVSIIQSNWRAYQRTYTWRWRKILIDLKLEFLNSQIRSPDPSRTIIRPRQIIRSTILEFEYFI